jgi:hypothetical protein
MNDPVNSSRRGQGILEDLIPLGENQIGGNDHTTSFVPFGQKGKEHLHFLPVLLNIAKIIEDNHLKTVQPFELPLQFIIPFGPEQTINQLEGGTEQNPIASLYPFVSQGRR